MALNRLQIHSSPNVASQTEAAHWQLNDRGMSQRTLNCYAL